MNLFLFLGFSFLASVHNGFMVSGFSDGIDESNLKLGRVDTQDRELKTRAKKQCTIKGDAKSDLGPVDTRKLRQAVTLTAIMTHLQALQAIADSTIDLNRASGSEGYDKSRDYVAAKARAAGYKVSLQEVFYYVYTLLDPEPTFAMVSPNTKEFTYIDVEDGGTGFTVVSYSGSGTITGKIQAVDLVIPATSEPSSTSGCEDSDFTNFVPGNIALIQRGSCLFIDKVENAIKAGAIATIIFNEGQTNRTGVLLANMFELPM